MYKRSFWAEAADFQNIACKIERNKLLAGGIRNRASGAVCITGHKESDIEPEESGGGVQGKEGIHEESEE